MWAWTRPVCPSQTGDWGQSQAGRDLGGSRRPAARGRSRVSSGAGTAEGLTQWISATHWGARVLGEALGEGAVSGGGSGWKCRERVSLLTV